MKKLKINYKIFKYIIISFFFFLFSQNLNFLNQIKFEIKGNNFTDTDVILSLIKRYSRKFR